jgi:hypothetical protein
MCTKNAFWRAENAFFLLNAAIHFVWYIRNLFECLESLKSVFLLKYDIHSSTSYLFQKL